MLVVAFGVAFIISAFIWRIARRIFLMAALIITVAALVAHIPYQGHNLESYRIILGLAGHAVLKSVRHGVLQYEHWGRQILSYF